MTDTITLTGLVATEPRHVRTTEGLSITSFRLASTQRRFDRHEQKWVDGDTNWYSITTFRQLALNTSASVHKGERVIVSGRVKIRPWDNGERSGVNVDIEADAVGHDLTWGSTAFSRSLSTAPAEREASGDASGDAALASPDDHASVPQSVDFDTDGVSAPPPF